MSSPRRIFVIGYPGDVGGANTELWHTLQLWRMFNCEVVLIPTWNPDAKYKKKTDAIGCKTLVINPDKVNEELPNLENEIVVSFCNDAFLQIAPILKDKGAFLVWCNCMTFLFDLEIQLYKSIGPFARMMFQSNHQRNLLETKLKEVCPEYQPETGFIVRGAFSPQEFPFNPRPHNPDEPFFVGRMARPDLDKWSSNTWGIYAAIQYEYKRALILGADERTLGKIGQPPAFADALKPNALPVQMFLQTLHCLLPVNGGAGENWPRAGLEAMSAGVPIVTQNAWGWQEMIVNGETGFLCNNDSELAHCAACLAYDETLRLEIAKNARQAVEEFCNPVTLWDSWQKVFAQ